MKLKQKDRELEEEIQKMKSGGCTCVIKTDAEMSDGEEIDMNRAKLNEMVVQNTTESVVVIPIEDFEEMDEVVDMFTIQEDTDGEEDVIAKSKGKESEENKDEETEDNVDKETEDNEEEEEEEADNDKEDEMDQ